MKKFVTINIFLISLPYILLGKTYRVKDLFPLEVGRWWKYEIYEAHWDTRQLLLNATLDREIIRNEEGTFITRCYQRALFLQSTLSTRLYYEYYWYEGWYEETDYTDIPAQSLKMSNERLNVATAGDRIYTLLTSDENFELNPGYEWVDYDAEFKRKTEVGTLLYGKYAGTQCLEVWSTPLPHVIERAGGDVLQTCEKYVENIGCVGMEMYINGEKVRLFVLMDYGRK